MCAPLHFAIEQNASSNIGDQYTTIHILEAFMKHLLCYIKHGIVDKIHVFKSQL